MIITNSFSINMLEGDSIIYFRKIDLEKARNMASEYGLESAIGHSDTARLVGDLLGINLEMNRVSLKMGEGREILIAQYNGPRLPEGSMQLPEGATIDFWIVTAELKSWF